MSHNMYVLETIVSGLVHLELFWYATIYAGD